MNNDLILGVWIACVVLCIAVGRRKRHRRLNWGRAVLGGAAVGTGAATVMVGLLSMLTFVTAMVRV